MLAAAAVLILNHAIARGNLLALLWDLLERALDAFTWAVPVAALVLIGLLVLGCLNATRRLGAFIVLCLNLAALIVIFARVTIQGPIYEQIAFLPAILSMLGAGWLAFFAHSSSTARQRAVARSSVQPPANSA